MKHLVSDIQTALLFAVMLFSTFMLLRNMWVYRVRRELLDLEHLEQQGRFRLGDYDMSKMFQNFNRLPSYNYMMWHFWIWDINKFLK